MRICHLMSQKAECRKYFDVINNQTNMDLHTEETKMKIGVIGAMRMEVDNLQANMTDTKVVEYSGITFVEGKIDGKECCRR